MVLVMNVIFSSLLNNVIKNDGDAFILFQLCIFVFLEPPPTGSRASSLFSTAMRMGSWVASPKRRTPVPAPTTRWSAQLPCPAPWATPPPASPVLRTTAHAVAPATRAICSAKGSASQRWPSPLTTTSASRLTSKT